MVQSLSKRLQVLAPSVALGSTMPYHVLSVRCFAKVVVMSATIHATPFVNFFGGPQEACCRFDWRRELGNRGCLQNIGVPFFCGGGGGP